MTDISHYELALPFAEEQVGVPDFWLAQILTEPDDHRLTMSAVINSSGSSNKRILKDLEQTIDNPVKYCDVKPLDQINHLHCQGVIKNITPYGNRKYVIHIEFPSDYPFCPPKFHLLIPENRGASDGVLCDTHINPTIASSSSSTNYDRSHGTKFIDVNGNIILEKLGIKWHPCLTLSKVLGSLPEVLIPSHNKARSLTLHCCTARSGVPVELRGIILSYMFITPLDNIDLRNALKLWFRNAIKCNLMYGHISAWDTSRVTDMSNLSFRTSFDEDINEWDVSNVTTMKGMFKQAVAFNQPLDQWDVSQVTNMMEMFSEARSFNQPLEYWNVENVTIMTGMFSHAVNFNQPLNGWFTSQVVDMKSMFRNAISFNQPLDCWVVSSVRDMSEMFANAVKFNQALQSWNVSKVTTMNRMFGVLSPSGYVINPKRYLGRVMTFNQSIGSWNVSNVTDMAFMFYGCSEFNQSLNTWNVSNVTNMSGMFMSTSKFNQPLNRWNVASVTDMTCMFCEAIGFNHSLQRWNVTNVTNMRSIFHLIPNFSHIPRSWNANVLFIPPPPPPLGPPLPGYPPPPPPDLPPFVGQIAPV